MSRARVRLAVGLIVVLATVAGCTGASAEPTAGSGLHVFAPADRKAGPALRGSLLDGSGTFDLADHGGDVVVVNFWAEWCAPCVAEADDLEQTYLATKDSHVTFLGINSYDQLDKAKSFLIGRASYPNVFDPSGKLALGFAVAPSSIPSTIIIDRQGRIAAITVGSVVRDDLEPVVSNLAAEPAPAGSGQHG